MAEKIAAEMTASVWKILVHEGDPVEPEQELLILESMKMEIPVTAQASGTVQFIAVQEGEAVQEGDPLLTIES